MFVPKIFILLLFFSILFSCSASRHLSEQTGITKATVYSCNTSNDSYKLVIGKDSVENFDIRVYSALGFKLIDAFVGKDTSYVKSAINDDLKHAVEFYFLKFENEVCLNKLLSDLLNENAFNNPSTCYGIEKSQDVNDKNIYHIFGLSNNRIFSLEKTHERKTKLFHIFNESFCIKVKFYK